MSFTKYGKKLSELGDDYSTSWIGSNEYGQAHEGLEKVLFDNRDEVFLCGMVDDDGADYSFDEWALVRLKKKYFLVSASGCSCPSPKETWRVEIGDATLKQVIEFINSGEYSTYSLPKRQHDQFMQMCKDLK